MDDTKDHARRNIKQEQTIKHQSKRQRGKSPRPSGDYDMSKDYTPSAGSSASISLRVEAGTFRPAVYP